MIARYVLSFIWVAAHHGLRRRGAQRGKHIARLGHDETAWQIRQWERVHELTRTLGNPPAPRSR